MNSAGLEWDNLSCVRMSQKIFLPMATEPRRLSVKLHESGKYFLTVKERIVKTFVKYSVLGAVALGLTGLAVAGPLVAKERHGERGGPRFEKLDANADGFVTVEEMEAVRLARFNERDTDQDGFLSLEELQTGAMKRFMSKGGDHQPDADEMADRAQRMLRYLDENGDGKVAFDEMPSHKAERMIARFDTDQDGKVSRAEFEEARKQFRMGRKGERHGEDHGPRYGEEGHGPRHD